MVSAPLSGTEFSHDSLSSFSTQFQPILPNDLCPPASDFWGNSSDPILEIESYHIAAINLDIDQTGEFPLSFPNPFVDEIDTNPSTPLYTLQEGLALATIKLEAFAQEPDFYDNMTLAFGEAGSNSTALDLIKDLEKGEVRIEILSSEILDGYGAFGNNTIFLSENLLSDYPAHPETISKIIIEEFGHYLDSQFNSVDAMGDEGAIFAHFVNGFSLDQEQLQLLKNEDDHGTIIVDGVHIAVEYMDEDDGIFTVGNNGEVTIDFLFDSGEYQSQLGLFSLEGMENLARDSLDFREEAARRALSNSLLGYVVLSDSTDGAQLEGELGEIGHNSGDYPGSLTFRLNAGEQFALILVPNGLLQDVLDNPGIEGSGRPLFSLAEANPDGASHVAQLGDGGFGIEDLRSDTNTSDADYNDIIFQVGGATAQTVEIEDVINPNREWRTTTVGENLFAVIAANHVEEDTTALLINVALLNDTGISESDGLTFDPTITGTVTDVSQITSFQAGFEGQLLDVLADLQADGSFNFDFNRLEALNGGTLSDGEYTLELVATDAVGNNSEPLTLSFTLDTQLPEINITSPVEENIFVNQVLLNGVADGTGSELVSLTYQLDQEQAMTLEFNESGAFNQSVAVEEREELISNLAVSATDTAGNVNVSTLTLAQTENSTSEAVEVAVPIQTDSGLQYIDSALGNGNIPTTGQLITVDYTGTLTTGEVFDSSIDRGEPFLFILGVGQVIAGWDEGVATMSVGSRRRLIIPADLAYGETGIPGVIPPNATLIFDVELLSIEG